MSNIDSQLDAQIATLGHRGKLILGAGFIVVAAVGYAVEGRLAGSSWIPGSLLVLGLLTSGKGLVERRQQQALNAEVERARSEWSELERELRAAKANGLVPTRVLQARGYRSFHVRRAILKVMGLSGQADDRS